MRRKIIYYGIAAVLIVFIIGGIWIIAGKARESGAKNTNAASRESDMAVYCLSIENGAVKPVSVDDFDVFVQAADRPVFVDFYADWCGPCRLAAPFVEQLALDYNGQAYVLKVNVDRAADLARKYQAQAIPLFIVMDDGIMVERISGYSDAYQGDLRQMIVKHIKS